MSNVRKKDRVLNRFSVLNAALDVYEYTSSILENENIFDRTYKSLIDKIDDEATQIYHYCRSANEDFDNRDKNEAEMRIQLQQTALIHCQWLKTYIMLAHKKFHLRAKRVVYWTELVNHVILLIKAWLVSEKRNYKKRFGL